MDVLTLDWTALIEQIGVPVVNEELDKKMKGIITELQDLASICSNDKSLTDRLKIQRQTWLPARDQYLRNVLHLAATDGNFNLVRGLVYSGGPINEKDGIGQTPLTLALHKGHKGLAKWLIENGSYIRDEDFADTVSPLQIVETKQELDLKKVIEDKIQRDIEIEEYVAQFYSDTSTEVIESLVESMDTNESVNFARHLNINVGDQKNTVNIFGCVNRCPDVYSCHTPGGGDFHNRGYLNESIARIAGHGGFWHVTEHVMKRPTINPTSFKMKFKDNNYNNNEEALLDYDDGLSIAMIKEFQTSEFFPSKEELTECSKRTRCHNEVLLNKFKEWKELLKSKDQQFAYQIQVTDELMPITRWYKESIRNGNGISMEAVWMLCPKIYAQVGKTNYRDESFTQNVNVLSKWPVAYRRMYQQNRTVNVNGRKGKQLAGDEWVEGYLVRPVKQYAAAQTSFNMLEKMSCSVDILELNRKMYKSRDAFDIHRTRKHHTPSSLYDQLRVAQFAIREAWFVNKNRGSAKAYSWSTHACKDDEAVPKKYMKALEKGEKKAESELISYLHRKHPNDMK
jgi:hypothetical protein